MQTMHPDRQLAPPRARTSFDRGGAYFKGDARAASCAAKNLDHSAWRNARHVPPIGLIEESFRPESTNTRNTRYGCWRACRRPEWDGIEKPSGRVRIVGTGRTSLDNEIKKIIIVIRILALLANASRFF